MARELDKDVLKKLRKELGFSVEKITNMMDTSYHTWYNWESGKCRVPGHILFFMRKWVERRKRIDRLKLDLIEDIDNLL